ncbi:MAG: M2 family metallopeptidase [Pseudomonadota bacterium]
MIPPAFLSVATENLFRTLSHISCPSLFHFRDLLERFANKGVRLSAKEARQNRDLTPRSVSIGTQTALVAALVISGCGGAPGVDSGSVDYAASADESVGLEQEEPSKPLDDGVPSSAVTVSDAQAFIERVEKWLEEYGEFSSRAAWLQQTNINYDSNWLLTKIEAEGTEQRVAFANEAKRFNALELPASMRRKIDAVKLGINVPAPERAGAARELAELNTRMGSAYATGKIMLNGESVNRNDLEVLMGMLRDPEKLREIWIKWREIPVTPDANNRTMKQDYTAMADLANAGARELGFDDLGAMWRSRYDLPPAEFAKETDRLWAEVKPLYDALHCHVRAKLNENYGDDVVPLDAPIRADLLGNMWAQSWGNIYDLVAPENADPGYNVTALLTEAGYDAEKMVRAGEAFFSSLGFDPLPGTFWERSQIVKPADREVACHASAWNLDGEDDIRIKMCTRVNADDFNTVHHELGHNYYQRAYKDKSILFKTGANGGFHEAIGDMIALSITPEYLEKIGLLKDVPDPSKDIGLLMLQALDKIAFMPFGLLMDKWRWDVFSGAVDEQSYNDAWWRFRAEYQGVRPPIKRAPSYFDPGAKYHIPNNVSYTRYFIAHILQFQFHEAACQIAGWDGPLHRCSIYGSRQAGEKFNSMLALGSERPWPDALEVFTGTREMSGEAVMTYFKPLKAWLDAQNVERSCGW